MPEYPYNIGIIIGRIPFGLILKRPLRVLTRSILINIGKRKNPIGVTAKINIKTLNYFVTKAVNNKVFSPALGKKLMVATGNKKTYKGILNPVKPEKKKIKVGFRLGLIPGNP